MDGLVVSVLVIDERIFRTEVAFVWLDFFDKMCGGPHQGCASPVQRRVSEYFRVVSAQSCEGAPPRMTRTCVDTYQSIAYPPSQMVASAVGPNRARPLYDILRIERCHAALSVDGVPSISALAG